MHKGTCARTGIQAWLLALVVGLLAAHAHAASYGGQAAPLFRYALGARSLSMGGAVASLASDAGTALVNPTGAAYSEDGVAGINALTLPMDRRIYTLGFAKQLDRVAGVSINWVHGRVDDLQGYDSDGNATGSLAYSENVLALSFARRIKQFALGVSAKYYRLETGDEVTSGWGFDFGGSAIVTPSLRLGASARNLIGDVQWNTDTASGQLQTDETVPRTLTAGASWMLPFAPLTAAADYEHVRHEGQYANIGLSWHGIEQLFLRAGYRWLPLGSGSHDGSFTAGASLNLEPSRGRLSFDYAIVDDPFGLVHTVGVRYAL